jgi:hypothetical protein
MLLFDLKENTHAPSRAHNSSCCHAAALAILGTGRRNTAWFLPLCICRVYKWVEGTDIAKAAGTAYPHTSHCLGSGEIMISTMGGPEGQVRGRRARGGYHSCTFLHRLVHDFAAQLLLFVI